MIDKPQTLIEVLLAEYEELGILSADETQEVKNLNTNAEKLDRIHKKLHENAKKGRRPTAVCFSGGGIRSATFGLGVLQGLAKHKLLDKFDYLSTVSGGGYIGSWLTAWIDRAGSIEKVQAALFRDEIYPYLIGLKDFNFSFEQKDSETLIDQVAALKEAVIADEAFFGKDLVEKLAEKEIPDKERLRQNPGERYKLKEFVKELCKGLNRMILAAGSKAPQKLDEIKGKLEKFIEKVDETKTYEIEPPEITHLRSYSNYMSPRPGLFSADTWALIAVYLRNLLLNWTVFIPLIAAILLLPRLFETVLNYNHQGESRHIVLNLLWAFAVFAGIVGIFNINAMRPTLRESSWFNKPYKESKVFKWILLWLLGSAFGITAYWVWIRKIKLTNDLSQWQSDFSLADNYGLFSKIFIGAIVLLVIFSITRLVIWLKHRGDKNKESWENFVEFIISLLGLAVAVALYLLPKDYIVLIYFILFAEILFLGGFDAARAAMKFRGKNFVTELVISFISGAVGGSLLYIAADNFPKVADYFSNLTGKDLTTHFYVAFGAPVFLLVFMLSATVFMGIASKITDDMDREWVARLGAWILIVVAAWSVIASVVLFGPLLFNIELKPIWSAAITAVGGISGLITLVLGFSRKSAGNEEKQPKSASSFLLWFAPQVAAPIFMVFLMILIVHGTNLLMAKAGIDNPWIWFAVFAGVGCLMGCFININKFSLHASYRERLIRCYLGASRAIKRLKTANSFTGLDTEDNVEMKELKQKPFHVVNMTLNLVKTTNLRWQNRKAESFTASANYCGSSNMNDGTGSYRTSADYSYNSQNQKAVTLGTAAAISGAAASPNMGYYTSSTAVSFLMALFNVRLGWWLGNPGESGKDTYKLSAPRFSPRLFSAEAFGLTNDTYPYIYLSDGGHFDNLGLYEMVLRRCHLIVVSDAASDAEFGFSDFGSSIHKIRVDFGIPIVFDKDKLPVKKRNCGIGRIKYSAVDGEGVKDGILIYIKPTLDGDEPIDIKNYKNENKAFPHESTGDQMYSEAQFESYRSLGIHMVDSINCRQECCNCQDLGSLEQNAEKYLQKFNEVKEESRKIRLAR